MLLRTLELCVCIHTSISAVIAHPVAIWETPAATPQNATSSSVLPTFRSPLEVKELLFPHFTVEN